MAGRQGDFVLRTSGDCPLIDVALLQRMVDAALADPDADFISNRINWSYPLGLSVDVISRRAIEWCDRNLKSAEDREFFATYVRDHADRFKVIPIVNDVNLSHHGWTVDEPSDVEFMRRVFGRLYVPGGYFGMQDVLDYLDSENRTERRA
jgi:spore coat polysaccharide biosynthesis protein SpsF